MKNRVLIVGGGVAALETALALRSLTGDRCRIEMFAPRADFSYRPNAVGQPFELGEIGHHDLRELARRIGIELHLDQIAAVDVGAASATTGTGESLGFDYLIAAPGAEASATVPGAVTFRHGNEDQVDGVIHDLLDGEVKSVAFTAPGSESWDLPIYELALITESRLPDELKSEARLMIITPEEKPLRIFGRAVSDGIAELLAARGIETLLATHSVEFDGSHLHTVPSDKVAIDAVISLPKLIGRPIEGLPHDDDGFIPVDDRYRVMQCEGVFAVGDVTSFPVKQGGIATQQADLVAETIAAELGLAEEPKPFDPILRGVLWTGEGVLYLQSWLPGGHGESSVLSESPPWSGGSDKIVGRYLTPFLAGELFPET